MESQPVVGVVDANGLLVTSTPETTVTARLDTVVSRFDKLRRVEVQQLRVFADSELTAGSFTLRLGAYETEPLPFNATDGEVAVALNALQSIEYVEVSRTADDTVSLANGNGTLVPQWVRTWRISFVGDEGDVGALRPAWWGANCSACEPWSSNHSAAAFTQAWVDEELAGQVGEVTARTAGGLANFTNVAVDRAGGPFTIRFIAFGTGLETGVQVVSSAFNVTRGAASRLRVTLHPENAVGGEAFGLQPRVALTDAGGNVIEENSEMNVAVSIATNPSNGSLNVAAGSGLTTRLVDGVALFAGLSIDRAGLGYVLAFTAEGPVGAFYPSFVLSNPFTVAVGTLHELRVLRSPSDSRAGLPLVDQPIVALLDRGGNLLTGNSFTRVVARIDSSGLYSGALSSVEVQRVRWEASAAPVNGSFALQLTLAPPGASQVTVQNTTSLPLDAAAGEVRDALAALDGVFRVEVVLVESSATRRAWDVTFQTEQFDIPSLAPTHSALFSNASAGDSLAFTVVELSKGCPEEEECANPITGAALRLSAVAIEGVASFAGLVYNRVEPYLRLEFTTLDLREDLVVQSAPFRVSFGVPTYLTLERPPEDIWFGGQAFRVQPVVALRDGGRNALVNDSASWVTVAAAHADAADGIVPLVGSLPVTLRRGVAAFADLRLDFAAQGVTLTFSTNAATDVQLAVPVDSLSSAEFLMLPTSVQTRGLRVGAAVGISGDLLVAGAPQSASPEPEVQTLTVAGLSESLVNEQQRVVVRAEQQEEVQILYTRAGANTTRIAGNFTLTFRDADGTVRGTTRVMDANAGGGHVQVALNEDVFGADVARVVRALNMESLSPLSTAFAWVIRFPTFTGSVPLLEVLSSLEGDAEMGIVSRTNSTQLGGSFTLALDTGSGSALVTSPIPFDATEAELAAALQANLSLSVVSVSRSEADVRGGREWLVEFASTPTVYDIPLLAANGSGLSGHGACAHVFPKRDGQAPVSGTFALVFGDEAPSAALGFNASAAEVEQALESIPLFPDVTVTQVTAGASMFEWVITFNTVLERTDYGTQDVSNPNIPALTVLSNLTGTNARVRHAEMTDRHT